MGLFTPSLDSMKKMVNLVPMHFHMCLKTLHFKSDMRYDGHSVRQENVDMGPFADHVATMSYDRVMAELQRRGVIK